MLVELIHLKLPKGITACHPQSPRLMQYFLDPCSLLKNLFLALLPRTLAHSVLKLPILWVTLLTVEATVSRIWKRKLFWLIFLCRELLKNHPLTLPSKGRSWLEMLCFYSHRKNFRAFMKLGLLFSILRYLLCVWNLTPPLMLLPDHSERNEFLVQSCILPS